jgi:hypothetical protein
MLDQFLIAPMTEGLQNDVEPWLIPENAFPRLKNAYVWRGRLRKRFGTKLLQQSTAGTVGLEQLTSRLRINLGNTDGVGDIAGTVPGAIFKIGQMFSIGDELFTVNVAGTPANMITNSGTATVFTYDTTTGAYDIQTSAAATACYFYPSEPVMGLLNYEIGAINDEPTYAFDTQFAYSFAAGGWSRLGAGIWTEGDSNFFWGENYRGANSFDRLLFVTNNSATDNIRYWNGTAWTTITPQYTTTGGDRIEGCRLIIHFKDRLLFLNTYERVNATGVTSNHPNRVRYSQNGSPIGAGAPLCIDAWYEGTSTAGKGGYVDAPTKEAIISAKILRDRLVVFFERSTWELVYTGNRVLPFVWQRINAELGVESTFSTVLFDKVVLGAGNVGMHACNGANVERIDDKIPQEVFKFHNDNSGVERVYGIRDYYAEMVYWVIPSHVNDPTYPTRVLVYNYRNKTWALNDDSITCFGYLQNLNDETWQIAEGTWQTREDVWNSGVQQSEFRQVIAGNQQGYIFIVDIDTPRNAPVLQITDATSAAGLVTLAIVDHNLQVGDYILVENVQGATNLDGIYEIVIQIADTSVTIREPNFAGTYTGGGTVSRVSIIDIITKQFNFYQKQGRNLFIPKVDFYVDRTANGQVAVDFAASSSSRSLRADGFTSGALIGTNILETTPYTDVTFEESQDKFWHIIYPQAEGESVQMRISLTIDQILDKDIALSDFQLNAISIYSRQVNR